MGNPNAIRVGGQAGAGAGAGHHGTVVEGELCRMGRHQSPTSRQLLSTSAHPSHGVLPSHTPPATHILNLPNLHPAVTHLFLLVPASVEYVSYLVLSGGSSLSHI